MTVKSRTKEILLIFLIAVNIFFSLYSTEFEFYIFVLSLIFSVPALYLGSESFVDESISLGTNLGMSGKTIGLVILSLGSIADEIFVSTIAAIRGHGDLGFGNIQGSNVITILPFFVLLPIYFKEHHKNLNVDVFILLCASILLIFTTMTFLKVPAFFSVFFFAMFLVYLAYSTSEKREEDKQNGKVNLVIMILSIILIYFASDSIVKYTIEFSDALSLPYFLSGFVVTGIAGSLPEVFMSVISFRKTRPDMAFGVIVGSTIYKVTLVLGLISVFGNMIVEGSAWSTYLLLFMTVIMIFYTQVKKRSSITALSIVGIIGSIAILVTGI